ncbi:hypothetical protein [Actinoallomurus acaciae]|uniref:Uncharacterized protein n=1 Tax=Actinoallomurus acaciae TaxID=502577 RepID=A0ABV5Y9B9_9ACTN
MATGLLLWAGVNVAAVVPVGLAFFLAPRLGRISRGGAGWARPDCSPCSYRSVRRSGQRPW